MCCTRLAEIQDAKMLKRGRHLYSAGRPSGWALAHISSSVMYKMHYISYLQHLKLYSLYHIHFILVHDVHILTIQSLTKVISPVENKQL